MTRPRIAAFLFLAAALAAAAPARAQVQSVDTSKPISIKAAKPPKPVSFAGAVVSSNVQSITVRSNQDTKVIRTFTYAPKIQAKVQQIVRQGGYPYGSLITVVFEPGSSVALHIKGKPSA
jgi:lipopolysaccharide export system protein LptA